MASLYAQFGSLPDVQAAVKGAAAAAAGLVVGTALKMARALKPDVASALAGVATFVAAGLMGWPLLAIVLILAPLAVAAAFWRRRA